MLSPSLLTPLNYETIFQLERLVGVRKEGFSIHDLPSKKTDQVGTNYTLS